MNTDDGRIYDKEQMEKLAEMFHAVDREKFIEMEVPPTKKQMARTPPKVKRNEPCPCNSGKKFKKCHYLNPNGG
jgi:uncharacterized protein YecA (UPF0149 family)